VVSYYVSLASSLLSAAVGAWLVYYFGLRVQRQHAFAERQLAEFYGPMVAIHKQIRAKSNLRVAISEAAGKAWREQVSARGIPGTESVTAEDSFAPFREIIEYNNRQLADELLPAYRQMLSLFTERYHLADPDTREFYEQFLQYVEIWNRVMAESLPESVLEKLDHHEANLKVFYDHLELRLQQIQDVLRRR